MKCICGKEYDHWMLGCSEECAKEIITTLIVAAIGGAVLELVKASQEDKKVE